LVSGRLPAYQRVLAPHKSLKPIYTIRYFVY
jgi:hypothetical protein